MGKLFLFLIVLMVVFFLLGGMAGDGLTALMP